MSDPSFDPERRTAIRKGFWLKLSAIALGVYIGLSLGAGDQDPDAATFAKPNLKLTPGVTRALSLQVVCTTRWGLDKRHVTLKMRKEVFALYGIPYSKHLQFELDHLIPRSLAGADDVRNLWPEPLGEAKHFKDPLEVKLGKDVCSGKVSLKAAQEAIRSNWPAAYEKFLRKKTGH